MNRAEYIKFHREKCDQMIAITAQKNADYTGGSGVDFAFSNFEGVSAVGIDPLAGFLTRMWDKFARISTFVKKGVLQVKDESVSDTLLDLANYCILMAGYIESKRREKQMFEDAARNTLAEREPVQATPPPFDPYKVKLNNDQIRELVSTGKVDIELNKK